MRDHSLQGYLERLPTEYLKGILANPANRRIIADYEKICEIIIKIIKEREKK